MFGPFGPQSSYESISLLARVNATNLPIPVYETEVKINVQVNVLKEP